MSLVAGRPAIAWRPQRRVVGSRTARQGVKLGGTLTIDVTAGDVTAANLLLGEPISAKVTELGGTGEVGGTFAQDFFSPPGTSFPAISLGFLTPSLVGYGGGPLASVAMSAEGRVSKYFAVKGGVPVGLASGALTVPEPPTWAMLLMGFAGLGFAGSRASRRTAAAATSPRRRLTPSLAPARFARAVCPILCKRPIKPSLPPCAPKARI